MGTYAYRDSVTIRAPHSPGGIHVVGVFSTIGDATIQFVGSFATTTLDADVYTNGDDKLFEDSIIIGQGRDIVISTGPLGGDITVEGRIDGVPDIGGLAENLTIIGGTGDLVIRGDIGGIEPLENLTIISAGRVTIYGSVHVRGTFRIVNTSGVIDIGAPLSVGGPAGNVVAGTLDINSDAIAHATITLAQDTSGINGARSAGKSGNPHPVEDHLHEDAA